MTLQMDVPPSSFPGGKDLLSLKISLAPPGKQFFSPPACPLFLGPPLGELFDSATSARQDLIFPRTRVFEPTMLGPWGCRKFQCVFFFFFSACKFLLFDPLPPPRCELLSPSPTTVCFPPIFLFHFFTPTFLIRCPLLNG